VALESLTGGEISVQANNPANGFAAGAGTLADVKTLGLNETAGGTSFTSSPVGATALATTDDLKINGTLVGRSTDGSALSKAAAINAISTQTGVQATAKTQVKVTVDLAGTAPAATDTVINGADRRSHAPRTTLADVVTAINAAGINGCERLGRRCGNLILTSEQGANITVQDT
jgi:flagellin